MKLQDYVAALACLAVDVQCLPQHHPDESLLVKSDAFAVRGTVWPNNSAAHFYGNIPYAEPPVGELRFRPPVTKAPVSETINGSWFGPSCIQYNSGEETVYTEYLSGFLLAPGQSQSEGIVSEAECFSQAFLTEPTDCLTLNIWAPATAKRGDKLPVMIWIHGARAICSTAPPLETNRTQVAASHLVEQRVNTNTEIVLPLIRMSLSLP